MTRLAKALFGQVGDQGGQVRDQVGQGQGQELDNISLLRFPRRRPSEKVGLHAFVSCKVCGQLAYYTQRVPSLQGGHRGMIDFFNSIMLLPLNIQKFEEFTWFS